jgi:polyhydroxyalkanoate synthesis regulator phasin
MKLIKEILESFKRGEISVEVAEKMISELVNSKKVTNRDSGDFRDSQNYESQQEYFGK